MRALYLHGFASTPEASKARFFRERLAGHGIALECPDLNAPDFSTLTVTRMITQVESLLAHDPTRATVLFGSSLGAFVAWFVAARAELRRHPLSHLVLLAPAIDFGINAWHELGEASLEAWRASGWREFTHHGYGESRRVHYALYDDKQQYDASRAVVTTPTLVCMGQHDTVVDPVVVESFFAPRSHVTLCRYDDGHQLLGHLDLLWRDTATFLGLPSSR